MQDKNFYIQLLKGDFHETKETGGGASFKCRHGFFRCESGASGLGAFLAVMDNPEYRKTMGFDETSVILLFSTEGDTDPDHYKAVVAD